MQIKGTVIKNDLMPFALVWSAYEDLRSSQSRLAYLEACKPYFKALPIILASEDSYGNPIYFGDTKLVKWLESQRYLPVKWENYTL